VDVDEDKDVDVDVDKDAGQLRFKSLQRYVFAYISRHILC